MTGTFGLVGAEVVRTPAAAAGQVMATGFDVPANRKSAAELPSGEAGAQLERYPDVVGYAVKLAGA